MVENTRLGTPPRFSAAAVSAVEAMVNVAVAPTKVSAVLFKEIVVQ